MNKYYDFQNTISRTYNRIRYYRQRIFYSPFAYERMYYENMILYELDKLLRKFRKYNMEESLNEVTNQEARQREFTLEELANYDGANGKPAYVAVNGIVYDVSTEATWGGGTHFGLYAGKDLTAQFNGCHGMEQVLNKLPKVGVLKSR